MSQKKLVPPGSSPEGQDATTSDSAQNEAQGKPCVGLDIGTMNIVAARYGADGKPQVRQIRDAFLDLPLDAKSKLQLNDVPFVEYEDKILVLGDGALEYAQLFRREARRPLSQGLISSDEHDALEVLSIMIESVVGEPREEDEICFYSIPAAPVDRPDKDVIYHEAVFERILEELGYIAYSGNEAMAVVFSECASDMFSGIGISFGSGMVNVALAYKGLSILEFSIAKGGDWIDSSAAGQFKNTTAANMCVLKEEGLDLSLKDYGTDEEGRKREALVFYYRRLISDSIKSVIQHIKEKQAGTKIKDAIPIVVSGGTSLPDGFIEMFIGIFDKKYRKRFPFEISEIRRAKSPLNSVATGLLLQASNEAD